MRRVYLKGVYYKDVLHVIQEHLDAGREIRYVCFDDVPMTDEELIEEVPDIKITYMLSIYRRDIAMMLIRDEEKVTGQELQRRMELYENK